MKFKELHKGVRLRIVQSFFTQFLTYAMIMMTPLYINLHFGLKAAGFIPMIGIALGFLASIYSGYAADKFGRKRVMLIVESVQIGSFLVIVLANSVIWFSPGVTSLMMALNMVAIAAYRPAASGMILDLTDQHSRKFALMYLYWVSNLAVGIGSLLGASLYKDHFAIVSLTLLSMSIVSILIVFFFIPETRLSSEEKPQTALESFKELGTGYKIIMKDKLFRFYMIGMIFFIFMESQTTNYVNVRLVETFPSINFHSYEITGGNVSGLLLLVNTLLVLCLIGVSTYVLKHATEKQILRYGLGIFLIGVIGIVHFDSLLPLILSMMILTIGEVLTWPLLDSYVGDIADENLKSSYLAAYNTTADIGLILASFCIVLMDYFSKSTMTFFFVVIALLTYLFMQKLGKMMEDVRLKKDVNI